MHSATQPFGPLAAVPRVDGDVFKSYVNALVSVLMGPRMCVFLLPKVAAGQTTCSLLLSWKGRPTTSVTEGAGAFRRLFRLVCT
jgi:hypothetical protein